MSDRDVVAAVIRYYEDKLDRFGTTALGVDWKDETSQALRFDQLVRALRLDGQNGRFSIVDYGCGHGALHAYLSEGPFAFDYTGYDRSAKMVEAARAAHPGASFTTVWDEVPEADFFVASGVFNVRLNVPDDEWREHVLRTLRSIAERARIGLAANFLTAYADPDRRRDDLYYADPAMLFDWCKRTLGYAALLHDANLYEFTVAGVRRPW